jgi:Transposase
MKVTTVGLDLAKQVFSVHGVDEHGKAVLRKRVLRGKVLELFAQLPPSLVGMEACSGAHHWARELERLGHRVGVMAARFVAPYRKSEKNDGNDAEAICEAVSRPSMRFVAVKSAEQQALLVLHRVRQGFTAERTATTGNSRRSRAQASRRSGCSRSPGSGRSPLPRSWRALPMRRASRTDVSSPRGWAWCRANTPQEVMCAWGESPSAAMCTCGPCSSTARARCSLAPRTNPIGSAAGQKRCGRDAARARPPLRWRRKTPGSPGCCSPAAPITSAGSLPPERQRSRSRMRKGGSPAH